MCMQVVAAGANPVLITRGIEKTAKALVSELKSMSKEVISSGLRPLKILVDFFLGVLSYKM